MGHEDTHTNGENENRSLTRRRFAGGVSLAAVSGLFGLSGSANAKRENAHHGNDNKDHGTHHDEHSHKHHGEHRGKHHGNHHGTNTVSGIVRGVVDDGTIHIGGQRRPVDFRKNEYTFDGIPNGTHEVLVTERDGRKNGHHRNGNQLYHDTLSVDGDERLDVTVDTIRGVYAVPRTDLDRMKQDIDTYRDLGVTDLYLRTFHLAETLYRSAYAPRKSEFPEGYLETVIRYAHRQGIRIHAWVHTLYWWNALYFGDVPDWHPFAGDNTIDYVSSYFPDTTITLDRDLTVARKDGTVVAENGKIYASPFSRTVRRKVLNVVHEIDERFDFDGINLDYIMFPGYRYYDADGDGENEFVNKPYGYGEASPIPADATYAEAQRYRVEAIRSLVEQVNDVIDEETILSGDVFPDYYLEPAGQPGSNRNMSDAWQSWIGTTGIDWIHTECYQASLKKLRKQLATSFAGQYGSVTVIPALAALPGHKSLDTQVSSVLSDFDTAGYMIFKGQTIQERSSLPEAGGGKLSFAYSQTHHRGDDAANDKAKANGE